MEERRDSVSILFLFGQMNYLYINKPIIEMKNSIVKAIVSAVTLTIVTLLLDLLFGNMHSFWEYVVQAVVYCVMFWLFDRLDSKWKK